MESICIMLMTATRQKSRPGLSASPAIHVTTQKSAQFTTFCLDFFLGGGRGCSANTCGYEEVTE